MNPALSIIIPLYNAAGHLSRLEHTLGQQGVLSAEIGVEILLIDDRSTDDTPRIVKGMMSRHSNIRYFVGQGKGQGAARNLGLDNARGEYIYMMDQDDMIVPGTLLTHLEILNERQADVVRFRFDTPSPSDLKTLPETSISEVKPTSSETMTGAEYILSTNGLHNATPVWTAIFNRRFAEEAAIRFDPRVRFYEDMIFMWRLLLPAGKVIVTDHVGYHWIQYPDSDMHTSDHSHKVRRRLTLPALVEDFRALIDTTPATETARSINCWLSQKADWYEFAYWSMVLSLRALGRGEAMTELERHMAEGIYPMRGGYPTEWPEQYPQSLPMRLRWLAVKHPGLLKTLIRLRLR